ncbi:MULTISPECIES: sensor domain-containing diguanylate cyclase [Nitrincola]|uniref:Putative diguanylate cyclase AdrA n=1 Tax=Nitrincola nitratireducens TaxID=1229521 RepID=W9V001_9GAMM|nr:MULTISPECIES: cache domain-containing protein [Nitrincola]EXJ09442.1 putative diguanylate cyclase AdrA [Nitrincola nitratireducens]
MRLSNPAKNLPKLHLLGTLLVVFTLTLMLGGLFLGQRFADQINFLNKLEDSVAQQIQDQLQSEMITLRNYLDHTRAQSDEILRARLIEQVDLAYDLMNTIYQQERNIRNTQEIKKMIVESLRELRFFDGRGYFFVDDMEGRFILLPTAPEFEGRLMPDNQDDTGHFIMQGLIEAARKPRGEGFSQYRWYHPEHPSQMSDKLAYVRYFEPFDWLIGTGDYTYEWDKKQQEVAKNWIRSHRFGQSGYITLFDISGQLLVSPGNVELEQTPPTQRSQIEQASLNQMVLTATDGGGFVDYWFEEPSTKVLRKKQALVGVYEDWGWILATTIFEDDFNSLLSQERQAFSVAQARNYRQLLIGGSIALTLSVLASLVFSRWSRRLFRSYHETNQAQQRQLEKQAKELKEKEKQLRALAFFDPLTSLPNRRSFMNTLSNRNDGRQSGAGYASLLFIDLDNFKPLNDSYGHDYGDLLLQQIADRLQEGVDGNCFVARLGGDEFVVLVDDAGEDVQKAYTRTENVILSLQGDLADLYQLRDIQYPITISIGATVFCAGEKPVDALLKEADLAMYASKAKGRNGFTFFEPSQVQSNNEEI